MAWGDCDEISSHLAAVAKEVGPTTQSFPGPGAVSGGEGMMGSPFELDQPFAGRAMGGSFRDSGMSCLAEDRDIPAEMASLLAGCLATRSERVLVAFESSNPASSSLEMRMGPDSFTMGPLGKFAAGLAELMAAEEMAELWSGATIDGWGF